MQCFNRFPPLWDRAVFLAFCASAADLREQGREGAVLPFADQVPFWIDLKGK